MSDEKDGKSPQGQGPETEPNYEVIGEENGKAMQAKKDRALASKDPERIDKLRTGPNDSIPSTQPRDPDKIAEGRTGPNDSFPSDQPVSYYVPKERGGHADSRGEATATRDEDEERVEVKT